MCLSNLQRWFKIILSTSWGLSKTNSTILSPWFWILNPLVDLHNCLKVRAITSLFRTRRVRNFTASRNSPDRCSFVSIYPFVSFSDNDKLLHWLASSSMVTVGSKFAQKNSVSQLPPKNKPLAPKVNLLPWEDKLSFEGRDLTLLLPKVREKNYFLSDRETG